MNKTRALVNFLAFTVTAIFAGCGGGGGDSGVSTISFPLQAGFQARIAAGSIDNFTLSGTCAGSATNTSSAATASAFEGIAGFAVAQTAARNFTNCTPSTNAVSGTSYFNSSYARLGSSSPGVEYTKFLTAPPPLPASVKVGDTAVYATLTTFTDSTKFVTTGQRVLSYAIEADTASTAVVNLISKGYDLLNQPLITEQSRYRIAADGNLTIVTIDVQYSTTSTTHIVFTKS